MSKEQMRATAEEEWTQRIVGNDFYDGMKIMQGETEIVRGLTREECQLILTAHNAALQTLQRQKEELQADRRAVFERVGFGGSNNVSLLEVIELVLSGGKLHSARLQQRLDKAEADTKTLLFQCGTGLRELLDIAQELCQGREGDAEGQFGKYQRLTEAIDAALAAAPSPPVIKPKP